MTVLKGSTRKRGAKAIAPEDVPSSEVRGDLLDNEISVERRVAQPQQEDTQTGDLLAVVDRPVHPASLALATLNPVEYVAQVFQPFRAKLDRYKAEADALESLDVATKEGMATAIRLRAAFRDDVRIAAEKVRVERKAPILEIGRLLDASNNDILAEVKPYEARFDKAIKDEEARKAAEKAEAERLARERVASIRAKIDAIAHLPSTLGGADSARLIGELQKLVAMQPTAEEFDGLLAEMLLTIETVGSALSALLDGARKREEEERRRIAEQEAERARLAAQAEENARIAAELERRRMEAEAAAKVQTDEMARLRADMERERAELEALREAMKPKPAPADDVPPNTASVTLTSPENPAGVTITWPLTDADHAPQFDWNTPAEHLESVAITPPAVEPAIDFAALDEPEYMPEQSPLGAFFDAVRTLRQTRTAAEVRKHLEVVLADVLAEIGQGAKGYKA